MDNIWFQCLNFHGQYSNPEMIWEIAIKATSFSFPYTHVPLNGILLLLQ